MISRILNSDEDYKKIKEIPYGLDFITVLYLINLISYDPIKPEKMSKEVRMPLEIVSNLANKFREYGLIKLVSYKDEKGYEAEEYLPTEKTKRMMSFLKVGDKVIESLSRGWRKDLEDIFDKEGSGYWSNLREIIYPDL